MRRSCGFGIAMVMLATVFALPGTAFAFAVTGGAGTQTQNPYGMWYAGKEACAQEGCHARIAAKPSPHSEMVKDVRANPDELLPAANSGLWPFTSPLGGISILPRDIYLQLGDREGFLEYVGPAGSSLATKVVPADDLPVWSPANFLIDGNALETQTSKLGNSVYGQSCSQCHNVGQTRPSNATYTLASGAIQSTTTPTTVSELGVQCESCHGSGKNPGGHKNGVPGVVGGYQILKAQVCGQCHVTGTTPQKNVGGNAFSNPNGYTTDATLSAYLTPATVVETEGAFMAYVNGQTSTKPKFLPNGANYSMRHVYYNEWLVNKVPSSHGGEYGHADPVNESVKTSAANGETKCFKCHSGLGFLNRIDAKAPTGTRIVPTFPTAALVATADPGVSCQVCHSGHVGFAEGGGYDSMRRWGNGKEVSCGDCHNWQFEMLDQPVQHETIAGREYTRPAANTKSRHAQREMVTGGNGGEDGLGGLWGVAPMGAEMPGITCKDCHMPRTSKEGMPANDDGSPEATRMSHRFHIVTPGDAERWKLRPNGDSCAAGCHKDEAAGYSRADFQTWIDQKEASVATASAVATSALTEAARGVGLSAWGDFISAQPATGAAAGLPAMTWAMLQRAAQNVDFVAGDGSAGVHNSRYALAGLAKAALWAHSATATLDATLGAGPALGEGMTASGTLRGLAGAPIPGAQVVLETSTDGTAWTPVCSAAPNDSGEFALSTGRVVGSRAFRVRFTPMAGVDYVSLLMPVAVPVTTAGVLPAAAQSTWVDVASVQVTLTATPGALTMYSLAGATTRAPGIYTGAIEIAAPGRTDVSFWSTDGSGIEATQTLPILIDRAAPALHSDVVAGYDNKAVVHVWGTDEGSGIASLDYRFKGVAHHVDGSSFTLITSALGKNSLEVTATDVAGKTRHGAVTVWVRASAKLTISPSGTKRISRKKSVRFASMAMYGGDSKGEAPTLLAGETLLLQRWNGSAWVTEARVKSGAGRVARTVAFSRRGTSRWRWHLVANERCRAASSPSVKVVVK